MKSRAFLALLVFCVLPAVRAQDLEPPTIIMTSPVPGPVVEFTQLTVTFSEPVVGVDADDLQIDGVPATGVSGGAATYTFSFPNPRPGGGAILVFWAFDHGITDLASNAYPGFDFFIFQAADSLAPTLDELSPEGISLPLTEIRARFSEPVTNVDAGDLLLNGEPALSVTSLTNNVFVFRFNPARRGTAQLTWAAGHGITDLSTARNAFVGGTANIFSKRKYAILSNSPTNAFVVFSNLFFTGVCTVDGRQDNRWVALQNFFTTQRLGQVELKLPPNSATEFRLRCLSVAPGNAFVNLAKAYGTISTLAGGAPAGPWQPQWEGADGSTVYLSDPEFAVADEAGNLYVTERTGHAVDKITPDGRIFTFIGRHQAGFDAGHDAGTNGPNVLLNTPSGLFIVNNTLYVLDAGNSRVRRVLLADPMVQVTTLFTDPEGIGQNAHGLFVGLNKQGFPNEALFGVGGTLRIWEDSVVTNLATGFGLLTFVTRDPRDDIVVADSLNHRIYEVGNKGRWGEDSVIAGTGFPTGNSQGGDADEVALPGATSVAFLPIGGMLIGLDEGARVWYVDDDDNAAPFIFGAPGVHEGDGKWFRAGGRKPKISNVKTVLVAPNGDIVLVEGGVVRKIQFLRHR